MNNQVEDSPKGIFHQLSSNEKFLGWVLLITIPRGLLHYFAFRWNIGSVIFDMYYLLILHFSLLFSMERMCHLFFKYDVQNAKNYYLSFIRYWILIFPMVPIVTIITGSKYRLHIEFFKYIPSFLIENNFLPIGMIFVIPLMLFFLIRHLSAHAGVSYLKAFIVVAIANTISYVVYYQWMLNLFYTFRDWFSETTAMCCYSLFGISVLLFITRSLVKRGVVEKFWLKVGFFMFYIYAFVLLVQAVNYFLSKTQVS
jgi:hypothetical protein